MKSELITSHFSKSYDLNQLLSTLTRFFSVTTESDNTLLNHLVFESLRLLNEDKTFLIHSDINYIGAQKSKLNRIVEIVKSLHQQWKIDNILHVAINWCIRKLFQEVEVFQLKYRWKTMSLIEDKSTFNRLFWIEDLFSDVEWIVDKELSKYEEYSHPENDNLDLKRINIEEVRELCKYWIWEILQCDPINVNITEPWEWSDHILLWNSTKDSINYYAPGMSIAQYLSFDIPHNMVHLIHLDRIWEGVTSYLDWMERRSFSEALSVLSENLIYEKLNSSDNVSDDIYEILKKSLDWKISKSQFHDWMLRDRSFEFRLRLVRLLWDYFLLSNKGLDEIVDIVVDITKVDSILVRNEILKYISELWLWAVYTVGYNKLIEEWYSNPGEILNLPVVPNTWKELSDKNRNLW